MITAVLGFFSAVAQFLLGLMTGIINWCRANPKLAIAILILVISNAFAWHYGGVHQAKKDAVRITALVAEVKKANDETTARNTKISQLEKDSKTQAETTEKALADNKKQMAGIVDDFKKKLAQEKAKNRKITVVDPGTKKDVEVEINPAGQVVCSRLHDTFGETLNEMVKKANEKVPQ